MDDIRDDYYKFDRLLYEASQYRVLKMIFEADRMQQDTREQKTTGRDQAVNEK
jgi:hypothetical protein